MSTLKERVIEAVDVAKNRGFSVADIAKRCSISVQAIYQWLDPLKPLTELKGSSLSGLSELSGLSPWYINDGKGEKILSYAKNESQKATLKAMEALSLEDQAKMPDFGDTLAKHQKQNGTK